MLNWLRNLVYKPKPEWVARLDYAAARLGLPPSRKATNLDQWADMVEKGLRLNLAAQTTSGPYSKKAGYYCLLVAVRWYMV